MMANMYPKKKKMMVNFITEETLSVVIVSSESVSSEVEAHK